VGEELPYDAGVGLRRIERAVGKRLTVEHLDVRVAGGSAGGDIGPAVAAQVSDSDGGPDVEAEAISEPLSLKTAAVGSKRAVCDIGAVIEMYVRVADVGGGDDVGIAVVIHVSRGDVGADVESNGEREPRRQQARVRLGRVEVAVLDVPSIIDVDMRV